jgi:hypothetical protein
MANLALQPRLGVLPGRRLWVFADNHHHPSADGSNIGGVLHSAPPAGLGGTGFSSDHAAQSAWLPTVMPISVSITSGPRGTRGCMLDQIT